MPLSTAGRLDLPKEIVSRSATPTPTGELIHDPGSTVSLFTSIIMPIFNGNENLRFLRRVKNMAYALAQIFLNLHPNFANEVSK